MKLGLVLTGGGARAAYQVGAIQALSEIAGTEHNPFQVLTGVSAGAINVAFLANGVDHFGVAAQALWDLWANLTTERIFRTDASAVTSVSSRWIRTLSFGGFAASKRANYLLDTKPLRELLQKELNWDKIRANIANGHLHGLGFSMTNYLTGTAISVYEGHPSIEPWLRNTRLGMRTNLTTDHVMASSAIPVFFPPVSIDGAFYGDGCVRLTSPVSPAIHLGSDRLITIGIRYARTPEETIALNATLRRDQISIAEIGGVLLNAVFLDSLETDLERLQRINNTISLMTEEQLNKLKNPLRNIPVLALRPSQDLGQLAQGCLKEFPTFLRFLLRGIGAKEDKGWDLLSYLAFESVYTRQLLDLGYRDTLRKKEDILEFMFGDPSRITR